ncbi:hypothetical protein [Pedobacter aquatilis]|uniref:hypothetical protein n=1 Tax=Pedobacter aquatilis TaxID=351343 RepID=UPI0029303CAF|nr:hypothetical protein [Pedobacter aquatilis]
MKTQRFLLSMILLSLITACSNAELGYNEKVTSVFLNQMKNLDEDQKVFSDSTALFHADRSDSTSLDIKADNLIKNADMGLADLASFKPSENAKAFHASVTQYLNKSKQYGTTIKQILSSAGTEKRTNYLQATQQYAELENMPDKIREIQIDYQQKAGLK